MNLQSIKLLFESNHTRRVHQFKAENGRIKLTDYPLSSESTVVEVGAYQGKWANEIYQKYHCKMYLIEPITNSYLELQSQFGSNQDFKLFQVGLSNKNCSANFAITSDSSGIFSKSISTEVVTLKKASIFLSKTCRLTNIDLLNLNIEGGEYQVIPELISSGWIKKINYLQIQFHDVNRESRRLRKEILKLLHNTHSSIFTYPFIWEAFKLS